MATMREVHRERITEPRVVDETNTAASKAVQVVYYVLGVVELLLLFRFAFKLFAANTGNAFVGFVYDLTAPLIAPFQGIFATPSEGGAVFETATLVAMIVYAVIAYVIARLLYVATDNTVDEEL